MYEGLKEGEGAKETSGYSPVINWGTLQIILNPIIQYDLCMTQVDFKNAFVLCTGPTQKANVHELITRLK